MTSSFAARVAQSLTFAILQSHSPSERRTYELMFTVAVRSQQGICGVPRLPPPCASQPHDRVSYAIHRMSFPCDMQASDPGVAEETWPLSPVAIVRTRECASVRRLKRGS